MRIMFLGAAREVTGSMHLLETMGKRLLVDCGIYQGRRKEARERNEHLPSPALSADGVVLTHAHIDHSGNLPMLVKSGFSGPIYVTPATADLCRYMLHDAARIQLHDAKYLNEKFKNEPDFEPVFPLYDADDVDRTLGLFRPIPYRTPFTPLPNVHAMFLDAGHILGSAQLVCDIDEPNGKRRLVFSGDLGRKGMPIIADPEFPEGPIDYLVMESTYGNRTHTPIESMGDELQRVVEETRARGGKIVIPAFAVGRTQELLYELNRLFINKRLPQIPVYIDSPLATEVTEVFKRHPECFDANTRQFMQDNGNPLGFPQAEFIGTREESMALNDHHGPCIIISASGMAEGGRVLHHLRNTVEDPRNTILIVGFMAEHTLGRRIAERRPMVKIWGVERELRARVEVLHGFSAHADRNDLIRYAAHAMPTRGCFLVHGEPPAQDALSVDLERLGLKVQIPNRNDVAMLD